MAITHQDNLKQSVFVGITLVVVTTILFLTFQTLKPFLGILVTSGILMIFINPVFKKINEYTKKPQLSAFFTIFAVLLFVVIPIGLLGSSLIAETGSALKSIQSNPELISTLQTTIDTQIKAWQLPISVKDFDIKEQVYQILSFLARNLGAFALQSGAFLLNLFFVFITVFYLLINQKQLLNYLMALNLFPSKHFAQIKTRVVEIVKGTLRGYLLVVTLQLVAGISGFLIFQIPSALLLGAIYGISSLFPIVGGFLIWVPVAIWQVAVGDTVSAIMLSIWFLSLSFLVENIIAPKIIGDSTKLHQLVVMFSVFGGIQYFGLLGMVLGPVIIALAFVSLSILKEIVAPNK